MPHARSFLVAALLIGANSAGAQGLSPYAATAPSPAVKVDWSFGPVAPHLRDAGVRTAYGLLSGTIFMGLGLGIDRLNRQGCTGGARCISGNPVQAGVSFAFLGTLVGATGPQLHSKCIRSGRAILGIVGAAVGATVAGSIMNVRLFNSRTSDPATWRTMTTGLVGLGLGAGVATAIC